LVDISMAIRTVFTAYVAGKVQNLTAFVQ